MSDKNISEGILFTDFYQLTMAQLYFREGIHEKKAQFDYFFRKYPHYGEHEAGYCIHVGLGWLIDWIKEVKFTDKEIEYLKDTKGKTGEPLFDDDFLNWLRENGSFDNISLKAVPEGRVVHPNVPLAVVEGPLAMVQILESSLLNHLNYQTLIATKACRIKDAGKSQLMLEFGLRRAQHKGANAGARAALIGGADFSSNTGISYELGYPPKGTHAHSMVQAFMALGKGELGAFEKYAEVYPDDCLLLVDTIDTLKSGLPNAIKVFKKLKKKGHKPVGIRLDSGDLAHLCIQSAKMLNEAGLDEVKIVLSNQLDELVIWQIISQVQKEAPQYGLDADKLISRLIYGVGTGLIVSRGQAALDGVYKIVAIEDKGKLIPALKVSESAAKTINPGNKRVWRIYDKRGKATADVLSLPNEDLNKMDEIFLQHPTNANINRVLSKKDISKIELLLEDVIKDGRLVRELPQIDDMRRRRRADLDSLDAGVKRIILPHVYHVSLTKKLWEVKQELIKKFKKD